MAAKKHPVVESLAKASKGLQFTSETEAGFEPFVWEGGDKLTKQRLLELAGAEKGTAVEEDTLDRFFRAVPAEDKAKFDKLAKALQEQLSGIKVYKVGDEAEKDVYIVGQTKDGHLAGLKTTVVET
jgi:histidine triad (HIT) family protein